MTHIQGIHPYADKFPMLPDGELEELAESIRENGQRQPIVLTTDGLILDGRNRAKACEMINVEPEIVTYEGDDLAEYVIDSNSSRRHMSTGARAMSNALVLVADNRRENGRWKRGTVRDIRHVSDKDDGWEQALYRAGVVIDYAEELASQVVNGDLELNTAYRQAEEARDRERKKLQYEQRLAAEEADSKTFIDENAPDLAQQVGSVFQSYVEAHDVWKRRNREEAEKLRREQEAAKRAAAERKRSLTEMYSDHIGTALMTLGSRGERDNPAEVMDNFNTSLLNPPQMERYYSLENLQSARKFIDALIEWRQSQ